MNKQEPNMVPYLGRLNAKEKAVIIYLMRAAGSQSSAIAHQGTLPFLPVREVVATLTLVADSHYPEGSGFGSYKRICKEMLVKLAEAYEDDVLHLGSGKSGPPVSWLMKLDSKKVYRRFGAHPERGKPLSFLPKEKVSVGVKWSLPKRSYVVDNDVLVTPCVALKRKTHIRDSLYNAAWDNWEVQVSAKCRHAVEIWLTENCQ